MNDYLIVKSIFICQNHKGFSELAIMYEFSTAEYADIIYTYGLSNGNTRRAAREYGRRFPNRHQPARSVFSASFRRLRETGHPAPRHVRPHEINVQNEENVVDAILENPSLSTRRLANQLQLSQNFVWRTLNKEVLHPYHRQSVQALHPEDNQQRLEFCQWILQQNARNPNFISLVLWSDESCFTRDGITNFHNEHVWSLQNPHAIRPRRFQRRFSVNVWGGIFNNTLLPIQIINDRLNGELYRQLLEHTLYDLIDEVPLNMIANM